MKGAPRVATGTADPTGLATNLVGNIRYLRKVNTVTQNLRPFLVEIHRSKNHSELVSVVAQDESGARIAARKAYTRKNNLPTSTALFAEVR